MCCAAAVAAQVENQGGAGNAQRSFPLGRRCNNRWMAAAAAGGGGGAAVVPVGWTALGDGVRKRVTKAGSGAAVARGAKVTVAYRGEVVGGDVFDDSAGYGVEFKAGSSKLIAGFNAALLSCCVGDEVEVIIPPAAGYGAEAKDDIPAGSTLRFYLRVLGVKAK